MKKILFFSVFTIIIFISGCKSGNVSNESDKSFNTLKILKWGPDEGKVGIIPNKQPDGKMGVWIDVISTEGIGEVQILFAGKPALTAIQPKLITAGIPPEDISVPGDKKVEIQSIETGQIINVGTFKVTP